MDGVGRGGDWRNEKPSPRTQQLRACSRLSLRIGRRGDKGGKGRGNKEGEGKQKKRKKGEGRKEGEEGRKEKEPVKRSTHAQLRRVAGRRRRPGVGVGVGEIGRAHV